MTDIFQESCAGCIGRNGETIKTRVKRLNRKTATKEEYLWHKNAIYECRQMIVKADHLMHTLLSDIHKSRLWSFTLDANFVDLTSSNNVLQCVFKPNMTKSSTVFTLATPLSISTLIEPI